MKQKIYHFCLPSQYWLTATFLRFQESYESPNPRFRGHGFSLEEFQDWYVTTRDSANFSYHFDWSGFNFPSYVVDRFTPDRFGPLSRKESWLLGQLKGIRGRFYVIGTYESPVRAVLQHEVVHGLFYLHRDYAKRVEAIVNGFEFEAFKGELRKMGYCEEVMIDEINAYITTGLVPSLSRKNRASIVKCKPKLLSLFKKQFGFDISRSREAKAFIRDGIHHIDGSSVRNAEP